MKTGNRAARPRTVALFPEDRIGPVEDADIVRLRLSQLSLDRPRQWGACWLACQLWEQLGLDRFWAEHLPPSRKGTRWDWVLQILVTYRLIDPGSEWRLYRHWFEHSAMAEIIQDDKRLARRRDALWFVGVVGSCDQFVDEVRPLVTNGLGEDLRFAFDTARRGVRVANQQAWQEAARRQTSLAKHRRQQVGLNHPPQCEARLVQPNGFAALSVSANEIARIARGVKRLVRGLSGIVSAHQFFDDIPSISTS